MSDLAPAEQAMLSCPSCAGQNDSSATTCEFCGHALPSPADVGAVEPDEVELDEAWRSAAASGFDVDMELTGSTVTCPVCAATFELDEAPHRTTQAVRDTIRPDEELCVVTLECAACGVAGRLSGPRADLVPTDRESDEALPGEVEAIHDRVEGSTDERPLGTDRQFFEPARPGSLRDQGSLLDEDGEDIRQYTGEPVETLEGWVLPQQQNVGPGNAAGGGEYPDPSTPPAQGPDEPTPSG